MTAQTAPQLAEKVVSTSFLNHGPSDFVRNARKYAKAFETAAKDPVASNEDNAWDEPVAAFAAAAEAPISSPQDASAAAELLKAFLLDVIGGDEAAIRTFDDMQESQIYGDATQILRNLVSYVQNQPGCDIEELGLSGLMPAVERSRARLVRTCLAAQETCEAAPLYPRERPMMAAVRGYSEALADYVRAEVEQGVCDPGSDDPTYEQFRAVQDKIAGVANQLVLSYEDAFIALQVLKAETTVFFDGSGCIDKNIYDATGVDLAGAEWRILQNVLRFVDWQSRDSQVAADLENCSSVMVDLQKRRSGATANCQGAKKTVEGAAGSPAFIPSESGKAIHKIGTSCDVVRDYTTAYFAAIESDEPGPWDAVQDALWNVAATPIITREQAYATSKVLKTVLLDNMCPSRADVLSWNEVDDEFLPTPAILILQNLLMWNDDQELSECLATCNDASDIQTFLERQGIAGLVEASERRRAAVVRKHMAETSSVPTITPEHLAAAE